MHYLLTDGPSHRDLADSPELPAVTRDDGDDEKSTLFTDEDVGVGAENSGGSRTESTLKCWVDLNYEGLMDGSRGVLLC